MFTAVLQLHDIAPKFSTTARESFSFSRSHKRPISFKYPRRFFAERLSTRRASFYSALVRLSCSQIRVCSCFFLRLRKRVPV